ncbi:MAG: alcohol dehydrogenase catalytic domain-containing protein [Verrucomicrobia bacterium]|nr:alcohol dehydrogenase catalytic domain-containing protein [Verrucomicrobiota bacterium]
MKAVVYRGPNDLRVEELPKPSIGPGELLIRVAVCGVCGTDLKKIHHGLVPPPRVFGHETAGTIVEVGAGVNDWRVGERIAVYHHVPCRRCRLCERKAFAQCPTYKKTGTTAGFEPAGGGYAEYVRVMDWIVAGGGITRIPDGATFEEAAMLEPLNTILKAVLKAGVRPDDRVVVFGCGPIGLMLMQLSKLAGAHVSVFDPIPERVAIALELGADGVAKDVRDADVSFVAAANADAISAALEATRPAGRVMLFAQTQAGQHVPVDVGAVCMSEKDLVGSYSSDIELNGRVADIVFNRRINVRALITHRFPMERINEAIAVASNPGPKSLKVMVQL